MRVLQLIDSLQTGGSERVAVNLANALVERTDGSFLCATRKEGLLKGGLDERVGYLFLKKSTTLDAFALLRLNRFIKTNGINLVHAHSTSYFSVTVLKLINSKIKIVWHDHYGKSEFLDERKFKVLRQCSKLFSHIFSVNETLANWAKAHLYTGSVSFLRNFYSIDNTSPQTNLKGIEGKRVLHLANFRLQKDHITLLRAFKKVNTRYPEWTLHCVGKDFSDHYMHSVQEEVNNLNLQQSVFFYGSKPDISNIIDQCQIGVLPSQSEGLPMALLEYGYHGLPVVVSNVGQCKEVVLDESYGILIEPKDNIQLEKGIGFYIENPLIGKKNGAMLKTHVTRTFSEEAVILEVVSCYNKILNP